MYCLFYAVVFFKQTFLIEDFEKQNRLRFA